MMHPGSKPGANADGVNGADTRTSVYNIDTDSEDRKHVVEFFRLLIKIERKRNHDQKIASPLSA